MRVAYEFGTHSAIVMGRMGLGKIISTHERCDSVSQHGSSNSRYAYGMWEGLAT